VTDLFSFLSGDFKVSTSHAQYEQSIWHTLRRQKLMEDSSQKILKRTRLLEISTYYRRKWKDNVKMDIREIWCKGMNWIHFNQNRDQWWAVVKTVLSVGFPRRTLLLMEKKIQTYSHNKPSTPIGL
jgi:hypothetical protein